MLIAEVRYYRVKPMCQKKELLSGSRNTLRNPSNPSARFDSVRTERLVAAVRVVASNFAPFTDEPATFLAQRALSKTLGLGSRERRH